MAGAIFASVVLEQAKRLVMIVIIRQQSSLLCPFISYEENDVLIRLQTFLMNGLIVGIKGILSFLSAPLIGALSDIWGRKFFLLVSMSYNCSLIDAPPQISWRVFPLGLYQYLR